MEKTFDYEQLLQMLRSKDEENVILALSVIDNVPFDEHFIKMIYLKKEANIDFDYWQAHAPESAKELRKLFNAVDCKINEPIGVLDISKVAGFKKPTVEESSFLLHRMFSYAILLSNLDTDFLELKNYTLKIEKND